MPRPRKCRKVCCLPRYDSFGPAAGNASNDVAPIILAIDEYETIRLIDNEGLSQEECSEYMKVARTTVQQIYTKARKKLATALVNGQPLKIKGGDYRLCDENESYCGHGGCYRHRCGRMMTDQRKKNKEK